MLINRLFGSVLCTLFLSGCYVTDDNPTDQQTWTYALPSDHGISDERFFEIDKGIKEFQYENIKSLIVLHQNEIIFENYYGQPRRQLIRIENLTALMANIALGIAISEGLISDIQDSIHSYLPEYESYFQVEPLKRQITIRHLLIHRSGLSWNESIISPLNPDNNLNQMRLTNDWSAFLLNQPLEALPGTRYNLNNGTTMLISKIIANVSGLSMETFLTSRLFEPLSIEKWKWDADPSGTTDASSGLSMSHIDFAKIGYLYSSDGFWNGEEIIPSDWVYESTIQQAQVSNQYHNGYVWWLFDDQFIAGSLTVNDAYFFPGDLGNHLYIVPHKELVILIGAENIGNVFFNRSLYLYFAILNSIP